jgi:hypothetical protein
MVVASGFLWVPLTLLLELARVWQAETLIWPLWLRGKSTVSPLEAAPILTVAWQLCSERPRAQSLDGAQALFHQFDVVGEGSALVAGDSPRI